MLLLCHQENCVSKTGKCGTYFLFFTLFPVRWDIYFVDKWIFCLLGLFVIVIQTHCCLKHVYSHIFWWLIKVISRCGLLIRLPCFTSAISCTQPANTIRSMTFFKSGFLLILLVIILLLCEHLEASSQLTFQPTVTSAYLLELKLYHTN